MAGDWIKVEVATLDKPEVARMAELLGVKRDEMLGILLRFWAWLDRTTCNGVVTHMSRLSIDSVMHVPGFGGALESVRWVKFDDEAVTLTVPNFERHNGKPAKSRALGKVRVETHRQRKCNGTNVTKALPEKRREEIHPLPLVRAGVGFERFWLAYPKKKSKGDAEKAWAKLKPDESLHDRILDALERAKTSAEWCREGGRYIPYPASWLNSKGWEDEPTLAVNRFPI